jgi:hypothetical protein
MIKTFGHVESFYYLTSGLKRRREDRHRLFKNGHEKNVPPIGDTFQTN